MDQNFAQFERLFKVVSDLRDPKDGCPWDLKQTHQTLLKYLVEESYEFIHAVESGDFTEMEEELGDVLLQVLLHSAIADQSKKFSFESVCKKLADKLIHRHPHVFEAKNSNINTEEVVENWEKRKSQEKKEKSKEDGTLLEDSLLSLPPLMSAYKIGKMTNKINFDWEDAGQVSYKVEEEWQELKEELSPGKEIQKDRVADELGDMFFSMVQLARHLKVDPEEVTRKANYKFAKRFKLMEKLIKDAGLDIQDMNQKEMDVFWDQAKSQLR